MRTLRHYPYDPPSFRLVHWVVFGLFSLAYALFVTLHWSEAYIDFGDGNYLYISARIAEGGQVYDEILAPQPPCHLFLGALLVKIAGWILLPTPLYLIRAFSLILHLASGWLTADLGRRAWGNAAAGTLAGGLFILMPLNLWWSLGYQSEPLEILFLLLMMRSALSTTVWGDRLAGAWGALAALTNATAAPFLAVLIIFMLIRNPRRALRIAIPALLIAVFAVALLEILTGGSFLKNVVFNQAGTYPRDDFSGYALGKLKSQGAGILWLEGFFIFFALIGLLRFVDASPLERETREGLAWFFVATLGSFLYVTKGGTMDYIFSLAGPALAILAGGELVALHWQVSGSFSPTKMNYAPGIKLATAGLAVLLLAGLFAVGPLRPLADHYLRIWNQTIFELPDLDFAERDEAGNPAPNVQQVKDWIERHSKEGDTILAPPFYAFLTGRRIWGDYSELFIWRIKDLNDRRDRNPGGEGWMKTRDMAAAIERRELPIVIIEMGQTGQLPEVKAALEKSYKPILKEPYPTRNTRLMAYIPR